MDFTSLGGASTAPVEATPTPGISLNLEKNSFLNLDKAAPALTVVKLCAGWDTAACGQDADLDISVMACHANGKITSGNDIVFYNQPNVQPGISLSPDNRTGAGDGDDETITINLNELDSTITKLICCVTIDKATEKQQTFGMVNNAYVRLVNDSNDKELAKFDLKNDATSTATAMVFAELVKDNGSWSFHTIGEGKIGDLNTLAALFM